MDCVGAVAGRTDPSVGWTKKLISTTALLAAGIEFFIFFSDISSENFLSFMVLVLEFM